MRVGVYRQEVGGEQLVGWLSQEQGEFVFRYDSGYAEGGHREPIPAFPELDHEYRAKDLWPFFAVRIPPLDRADVKDALDRHRITAPDENALLLLAALAGRSIANRYELRLSEP